MMAIEDLTLMGIKLLAACPLPKRIGFKCVSVEGGLWYRMENQGSIHELQAFESNFKSNRFGTSSSQCELVQWHSYTTRMSSTQCKYSVAEQSTIGCSSSLAAAAAAQAGQPTPAPSSVPTLHPAGCLVHYKSRPCFARLFKSDLFIEC